MAYEVPHQWSRGDAVTAARMNAYSNGQEEINSLAAYVGGSVAVPYDTDFDNFFLQHVHRWLHYDGNGTITNPNDTTQTVSLSEGENGTPAVYDLNTISWLYYGAYYIVDGPDWVAEDWEP